MHPLPSPDAEGDRDLAETLTLLSLVVQGAFLLIGLILLILLLLRLPTYQAFLERLVQDVPGAFALEEIFATLSLLVLLVGALSGLLDGLFLLLTYLLVYRPLQEGRVQEVLTPSLVLTVLMLVLGGFVPGLLLLFAYLKARDAEAKVRGAPSPG